MLKIFNHLKINYQIKVRIGLEEVQPRTVNEQILESNLVRQKHRVFLVEQIRSIILELHRIKFPEIEQGWFQNLFPKIKQNLVFWKFFGEFILKCGIESSENVELTREMVLESIKKSFGIIPDAGNNDQRAQTSHSSVRKTQNSVLVNPGT